MIYVGSSRRSAALFLWGAVATVEVEVAIGDDVGMSFCFFLEDTAARSRKVSTRGKNVTCLDGSWNVALFGSTWFAWLCSLLGEMRVP